MGGGEWLPECQQLSRWYLCMDNQFHLTLYNGSNWLSTVGITLIHVTKRGLRLSRVSQFILLTMILSPKQNHKVIEIGLGGNETVLCISKWFLWHFEGAQTLSTHSCGFKIPCISDWTSFIRQTLSDRGKTFWCVRCYVYTVTFLPRVCVIVWKLWQHMHQQMSSAW